MDEPGTSVTFIMNCPHGVHPAYPCASCGRGYPTPVVMPPATLTPPTCPECGALVGNQDQHAAWHNAQAVV